MELDFFLICDSKSNLYWKIFALFNTNPHKGRLYSYMEEVNDHIRYISLKCTHTHCCGTTRSTYNHHIYSYDHKTTITFLNANVEKRIFGQKLRFSNRHIYKNNFFIFAGVKLSFSLGIIVY